MKLNLRNIFYLILNVDLELWLRCNYNFRVETMEIVFFSKAHTLETIAQWIICII